MISDGRRWRAFQLRMLFSNVEQAGYFYYYLIERLIHTLIAYFPSTTQVVY